MFRALNTHHQELRNYSVVWSMPCTVVQWLACSSSGVTSNATIIPALKEDKHQRNINEKYILVNTPHHLDSTTTRIHSNHMPTTRRKHQNHTSDNKIHITLRPLHNIQAATTLPTILRIHQIENRMLHHY